MISVVITTRNDEATIARCIKSVLWADEIVVVDAYSRDKTGEIAANTGARVIEKEWEGFSIQQEFAVLQTLCEWVLLLDPSEEVTKELKSEILHVTQSRNGADGYTIGRKNFFLGAEVRYGGWQKKYHLCLFKKSKTRMMYLPDHSGFAVDGTTLALRSLLTYHACSSLQQYIERMNEHSTRGLDEESSDEMKTNLLQLLFSPAAVFMRKYIVQLGFVDRLPGFLSAYYASLSTMVMHSKRWEKQHKK